MFVMYQHLYLKFNLYDLTILPLFVATYLDKNYTGIKKKFMSESKVSLQQFLLAEGFQYVSIQHVWLHQKITDYHKAHFFQSCADLLESGLNLQESLKIYEEQCSHKILKIVTQEILDHLSKGRNIFDIQRNDFFDDFIVSNLKQICSTQSNLVVFKLISEYYFEKIESKKKLTNVLFYPLLTLFILGVSLYFSIDMVLPSVLQLVPVSKISLATKSLMFVKDNVSIILYSVASIFFFMILCRKNLSFIPIVARFEVMDFWRQMSFCLSNQFHFNQALHIVKDNFNARVSRHIYYVIDSLNRGHDVKTSFLHFPGINKAQLHVLKMGEISGCMEKNLKFISEQEQKFKKNMSDKIIFWTQPILLLIMGIVLMWILLGTVVPIYENFHEMGS